MSILPGEFAASASDLEPGDRVQVMFVAQTHEDGVLRAAIGLGSPQDVLDRGGAIKLLHRGETAAPDELIRQVLLLLDLPDTPQLREIAAEGLRAGLAKILNAST